MAGGMIRARKSASLGKSEDLLREMSALADQPADAFRAPAYDAQAALALMGEGFHDLAEAILSMGNASPALRPALAALRVGAHDEARAKLRDILAWTPAG